MVLEVPLSLPSVHPSYCEYSTSGTMHCRTGGAAHCPRTWTWRWTGGLRQRFLSPYRIISSYPRVYGLVPGGQSPPVLLVGWRQSFTACWPLPHGRGLGGIICAGISPRELSHLPSPGLCIGQRTTSSSVNSKHPHIYLVLVCAPPLPRSWTQTPSRPISLQAMWNAPQECRYILPGSMYHWLSLVPVPWISPVPK